MTSTDEMDATLQSALSDIPALFNPENAEKLKKILIFHWQTLPEEVIIRLRSNFNQSNYYFVFLYQNGKFVNDEFVYSLIDKYGITVYPVLKFYPKYFSDEVFQQIRKIYGLQYTIENYAVHLREHPTMKKFLLEYFNEPQSMGDIFLKKIVRHYFKDYLTPAVVSNIQKVRPDFDF